MIDNTEYSLKNLIMSKDCETIITNPKTQYEIFQQYGILRKVLQSPNISENDIRIKYKGEIIHMIDYFKFY